LRYAFVFIASIALAGCGGSQENSANNSNRSAQLPPGFSASPNASSNAAAIAANVNSRAPGLSPTPGIPNQNTIDRQTRPAASGTPGIPDETTVKRQAAGQQNTDRAPVSPMGNRSGVKAGKMARPTPID
jgi:hypothetical protein